METVHLKGMTWEHPRAYSPLEAASKVFAEATGAQIRWDRRSLQAFADASIKALAAEYDLIVLDHPHVGLIAESECLLPLPMPEDAATASIGGSLESYLWDGQLWAYPIDATCQVGVRRPDLCFEVLPDWETMLQGRHSAGSIATALLPVDAFDMMMTLIASRGEENLPHSADRFCSDENGELALRVLKALYKAGPSDAVRWNPINVLEAMSTTDEFGYSPCLFGYINYARTGFRPHALDYVDLPIFRGSTLQRGILGGAGIGASALTSYPAEAIGFARWVTSEPVQSGMYLENEGQPAHRQSWHRMGDDVLYRGFLTGALHTMENAWTRPRDIWFLGFVDEVCEIFPDFFLKDREESRFLAGINKLFRKYSRLAVAA